jgi:hypothetical protein
VLTIGVAHPRLDSVLPLLQVLRVRHQARLHVRQISRTKLHQILAFPHLSSTFHNVTSARTLRRSLSGPEIKKSQIFETPPDDPPAGKSPHTPCATWQGRQPLAALWHPQVCCLRARHGVTSSRTQQGGTTWHIISINPKRFVQFAYQEGIATTASSSEAYVLTDEENLLRTVQTMLRHQSRAVITLIAT